MKGKKLAADVSVMSVHTLVLYILEMKEKSMIIVHTHTQYYTEFYTKRMLRCS